MDGDQHGVQNYGSCGIYKESFSIIMKWKRIFSQITLALILPLSIITLAHTLVPQVIIYKSKRFVGCDKRRLEIALRPFDLVCFIVVVNLFIFSTAAVVYTVACIYVTKETDFKKAMRVVLRMWKRLMVIFLWSFTVFILFNLAAGVLLVVWILADASPTVKITTFVILLVVYVVGFVYIAMIWQLASVVSVLEDVYGRKALGKARKLMKGKMKLVAVGCFVGVEVFFMVVMVSYELFVLTGLTILALRILIGIACGVLLVMVILYGLVVPTVLYFVCTAYHNDESVDKSTLSEHLDAYLGQYVTIRKDVQPQEVQNHV